jgi:hypothetical protein
MDVLRMPAYSARPPGGVATEDQTLWDAYNLLCRGPDVERLRKLLVRHDLFRLAADVPGDIVECGVFKGAGLMTWLKMLAIYQPGSGKRVVGFDTFSAFPAPADGREKKVVADLVEEANFRGITTHDLDVMIESAGLRKSACDLVAGDIRETARAYVAAHPGFRISLLHLDLDLGSATHAALETLWPRVVRGGVVVFDEYAVSRWTESEGVDRFFATRDVSLRAVPFARTPTAYAIKA